jgi:hypothetical protein
VFVAVFVGVLVAVLVGVLLGVNVFVAVFVGVLLGVSVFVGVFVGVLVAVLVCVFVGVFVKVFVEVRVKVFVGVGVGDVGRTGTAPMAQDLPTALPSVQVIVTEAAPGFVLPPPMTSLGVEPVVKFQSCVWPAPTVRVVASPRTPTVSKTTSPVALATVTLGVVVLLLAPTNVPSGVVWSTSEKDCAPAPKTLLALIVTVTVCVPVGGARRRHISIRDCVAWPSCAPTGVRAWAP